MAEAKKTQETSAEHLQSRVWPIWTVKGPVLPFPQAVKYLLKATRLFQINQLAKPKIKAVFTKIKSLHLRF